jgi:pimeloyl-ACP methyl ester carboxylesterase
MKPATKRTAGSATGRKLDVPGGHIAYETAGRGSPILFIHSVIADRRMWDREFSIYSKDHQVVRFDLRGFGGSSPASAPFSNVRDVEALVAHLRLPRPFVVGSSMGGALAIDYALANPDQVSGLLLAAPGLSGGFEPPFERQEMEAFEYDDKKSQEIAQAWSKGDRSKAVDLLRQLWCAALKGPSLDLFRNMVEQNATEVFESPSQGKAERAPPAAGRLGTLRVPTAVLVGDRDNPSSSVFTKRIARAIPGARHVEVPGADHLINLSRPDAFDAELQATLQAVR